MGSSKLRLIGYLPYYFEYPIFYKVFGVGANQFPIYLKEYNVYSYSSTIVVMLLDYGIIGFGTLMHTFYYFLKNNKKTTIIFTLIFITVCGMDRFWFNWYFFYLLTFVIIYLRKDSNKIKFINYIKLK